MEPQQQQNQQAPNEDVESWTAMQHGARSMLLSRPVAIELSSFCLVRTNEDCGGGSGKGSFLCRQSSARWTPTTDQIRILKDLYNNNGVRSPSTDQIQRISARLRQYGKIEGKNVFYWFQNHKARERQKKRFTTTTNHQVPMQSPTTAANNKYPNISPGYSPTSLSSTGALTVGQIGNYGYGSITMEKSFRLSADCSISACGGSTSVGESLSHNFGWVGNIKPRLDSCYSGWYKSEDGYTGSRASLELSLNPYAGRSQDSI
ncbi:hypothetical protein GOBAR_AA09840 [Gossypium barbadense]|uniref:Homeobox domain-containing protein n=1 Tax=Gossypium barbadense TaxID=3634 RepID=A0A2P5Y5D1_GOSBA|nr:hypothetical protein GOBAR_AA09840 [Gossypium barbadense]